MVRMTTDERSHMALALDMVLTPESFGPDETTNMIRVLMSMIISYETRIIETYEGD